MHPTSVETGVVIVRDGLPLSGHLDSGSLTTAAASAGSLPRTASVWWARPVCDI